MSLRIGIDVSDTFRHYPGIGKTGVSYVTSNLVKAMIKFVKENDYVLFVDSYKLRKLIRIEFERQENAHPVTSRIPKWLLTRLWIHLHWPPVDWLIGQVDIFHCSTNIVPPQKKGKTAITIYDLTTIKFPQFHPKGWTKEALNKYLRDVKRADLIIAISESTKKDVVEILKVPERKISVVYPATSKAFRKIDDPNWISYIRSKYEISRKYILYVGTLEPRKNLIRLVKAYYRLKKDFRIEHQLVLAGGKGWLCDDIFEQITQLRLDGDVVITGYIVDEEDVAALMNGADLFVYPSIYEGFGLPPLEAMCCGAPVITSTASSLPEVVGDAAILVNPYDVGQMTEAMHRVLTDEVLQRDMRRKSSERAKIFSWEKTAKETLRAYEQVCEGI